ncbi:hypothetical protein AB0N28_31370 [Streptomyces sp. NPDC051130]
MFGAALSHYRLAEQRPQGKAMLPFNIYKNSSVCRVLPSNYAFKRMFC